MKKIIISLCLVFFLAHTLLFAAGQQEAVSETDEHMTISWMTQNAVPLGRPESVQYLEEKFNVTFEFIQGKNYWEWLNLALAANDVPDMVGEVRGGGMPDMKEYGLATFTYDEFTKHMPKYSARFDQLSSDGESYLKSVGNSEGEINTIPGIWETAAYPLGIVWRKDRLDELGIDVPKTIAEAGKAFELFKLKWPDEYPYTGMAGRHWGLSGYLVFGAYGIHPGQWILDDPDLFQSQLTADGTSILSEWLDREKVLISGAVHPRTRDALKILTDWLDNDYFDPEWLSYTISDTRNNYFWAGKGLVSDWAAPNLESNIVALENNGTTDFELIMGPWLKTEYYPDVLPKHASYPAHLTGAGGGVGFGIQLENNREKMYRIMEILEACSMDEVVANRMYWGIEGVNWEWDDNRQYKNFISGYATGSEANAAEGLGYLYIPMGFNPAATQYVKSLGEQQKNLEPYHGRGKLYDWTLETANDEMLFGRIPPGKMLMDEKEDKLNFPDLDIIYQSAYAAIITGEENAASYFDNFVQQWYNNGGAQMTRAMNDQFLDYWTDWTP